MQFSEDIYFWSSFTFWFVVINVFLTIIFTGVVIVGGISDLKFLFKALREEQVDESDDGRVVSDEKS